MKVLDTRGYEGHNQEWWFKVKLERNTDVLLQELFTQNDIDNAKKEAVKEFLAKLYDSWANS